MKRFIFLLSAALVALSDRLLGRGLAYNDAPMTPTEVRDGVANLDATAAIATKNYLVVRGADDSHFKVTSAATDFPLGILLNDEVETAEIDVVKKGIALFGSYQGSLPAVAAAAITVDDWLTPDLGTPGRVKTLPTTTGVYWVVGKSRKTVSSAGDAVSINHCVPFQIRVGTGYVTGEGGAVTQATSSSTGVTLNKLTGQITTVALTTAAAAEERFTVTNSQVAATDVIALSSTYNGNGTPSFSVVNVTGGTFDIVITNLHASAAFNAAMVINFAVIKAVAA